MRRVFVLLTAIAIVSCGSTAAAGADASRADARLQRALHRLTQRAQGPPGAIVVLQRRSDLRVVSAGVADLKTGTPLKPSMHMRIASTSKAYSGAVALSLVARGRLALDDTIGQLLPWAPRSWGPVTLAEALHHTSGLPDFSSSRAFREYFVDHLRRAVRPRRLLHFVAGKRPAFAPGTEYRYSNSDNVVVGLMVRAVTGRRYEHVLGSRVLRPLGLAGTSLPRGPRMPRPYIHGYDVTGAGPPEDVSELFAAGYSWASGGIVSTPLEQNRFIRAYVGRAFFGRRMQARQFDFVSGGSEPPGPGRNEAGLAIFRYRTKCGTMFGHTGNTAGYTQFIAASRNGRRSVSVSISSQASPTVLPRVFGALRRVFTLSVCDANHRG